MHIYTYTRGARTGYIYIYMALIRFKLILLLFFEQVPRKSVKTQQKGIYIYNNFNIYYQFICFCLVDINQRLFPQIIL